MMERVLLAGFGGQGVMFIGKVLAYSGMLSELEVCWIPSYGPEMRGGTANCSVIIADEEIHSPVIELADGGIVLNQPSYDKFVSRIKPGGVLVVNSSIVVPDRSRDDITIITIPATDMANKIGNPALANMVCLGALLPVFSLVNMHGIEKAMAKIAGNNPALCHANLAAIQRGLDG